MNKLIVLCGMVFLGITSTPQSTDPNDVSSKNQITSFVFSEENIDAVPGHFSPENWICTEEKESTTLELASIPYLEIEEEVDLGFNTAEYLPENFDPQKVYFDLSSVVYHDLSKEEDFIGNLSRHLPEGFDPYASPADFMDISYIDEEDIELGFDTRDYLPVNFDPYKKELDLNSIVYLEEEEVELGFDTTIFLPENFDPYSL